MRVRPWVAFTTSLPDDRVGDGQQTLVLGGRNVAVAIGEVFTRLGCRVSPPESAGELGWEFDLRYKGSRRFWCRVTSFYPAFHLLFEGADSLFATKEDAAAYAELAGQFAAALKDDPRFQHISWWSLKEGPPEPEEIASIAHRQLAVDMPLSPIDLHDRRPALTSSQLGCLSGLAWLLAAFGGLATVIGLNEIFRRGAPWGALSIAVPMLGAGLILILLVRSWRADR